MTESLLGEPVDFDGATAPGDETLEGRHVLLRPLHPREDAPSLYEVSHPPQGDPEIWRYLPYGPYPTTAALRRQLEEFAGSTDPRFYAVVPALAGRPEGVLSYLRIFPEHGTIEIGHVWFGTPLQRTAAATEAVYLLARHAFDRLGNRRLEWKCNALNAASRRAAERFGFRYEGTFAKHQVVKGRNRDTAWFALTDDRWPAVRAGFEAWLAPDNFDADGRQRRSLRELTGPLRPPRG